MTTGEWMLVAWFGFLFVACLVMTFIIDPIKDAKDHRRFEMGHINDCLRQQREAISKLRCRAWRADRMALEPLLGGKVVFGGEQPSDARPTKQFILRNGAIYNVALDARIEPGIYVAWEVGEETAPMEVVRE